MTSILATVLSVIDPGANNILTVQVSGGPASHEGGIVFCFREIRIKSTVEKVPPRQLSRLTSYGEAADCLRSSPLPPKNVDGN